MHMTHGARTPGLNQAFSSGALGLSREGHDNMELLFTVNSGFFLRAPSFGILVDGIHRGEQVGFSAVPQSIRTALRTRTAPFTCPMVFLFTHDHPDHFDPEFLAMVSAPESVYGPGIGALPFHDLGSGIRELSLPVGQAFAFQVPHEGRSFSNVPHHALLLYLERRCLLMAGDAEFPPELAHTMQKFCPHGVDAVCVNPYQLLSPSTLSFLSLLRPRSIFLSHLPFPQDDKLGCYALADHAAARYPADFPPLIRPTPMSWLHIPLYR